MKYCWFLLIPSFAFAQQPSANPPPSAQFCGQLATMLAQAIDERAIATTQVEELKKQLASKDQK